MINLREKRNQGTPAVYGANNPDLPNASGGNQQMSGAPASQEPSGRQSDADGANAAGVQGAKINESVTEPPAGTMTGYDRNGNPVSIAPQAGQQIQFEESEANQANQANQANNIVRDDAGNILGTYEAATGGAVGGQHGAQGVLPINGAAVMNGPDTNQQAPDGQTEPPVGTMTGYDRNGNPVSINPEFTQEEVQGGSGGLNRDNKSDETHGTVANQLVDDWSDGFMTVVGKDGKGYNIPLSAAIQDYNQWASNNNQPALDIVSLSPWLSTRDMSRSAAENDQADKRQAARERWEQIGNVLRHVGNFVGAVNYAPVQNVEPMSNLTARQRALRDDSMALRRRDTQTYVSDYLNRRAQEAKDRAAAIDDRLKEAKIKYENARTEGEKARAAADVRRLDGLSQKYKAEAKKADEEASQIKELTPKKKEEILSRIRKNNRSGDNTQRKKKQKKKDSSKNSKGSETQSSEGGGGKGISVLLE